MTNTFNARANLEAEECIIGLAMVNRGACEAFVGDLEPRDFYSPKFGNIFAAIVQLHNAGDKVDALTVADTLAPEQLASAGGMAGLAELTFNAPSSVNANSYSTIVRRESAARTLDERASEARRRLAEGEDPVPVAEELESALSGLDRGGRLPGRYWKSWEDYLDTDHVDVAKPLIEGMCNQHTRTILLAAEKLGKSMLARQIAFCAAAGIHPFTKKPITPVRVLVLDAENDDDELLPTSKALTTLLNGTEGSVDQRPSLFSAPYGLDLRSRRDRSELEEVLEDCKPQLIVGGPIYKLMPRHEREDLDSHAANLFGKLDNIRRRWGCALLIEHHAPTGKHGEVREIRSKGGQQFQAWPEVTVALHASSSDGRPDEALVKFPHPPRGKFVWPRKFQRGTHSYDFPWEPVLRAAEDYGMAPTARIAPRREEF